MGCCFIIHCYVSAINAYRPRFLGTQHYQSVPNKVAREKVCISEDGTLWPIDLSQVTKQYPIRGAHR